MSTPSPLFPPTTGPFLRADTPTSYTVYFDGSNYRADSMIGTRDFTEASGSQAVTDAIGILTGGGVIALKDPFTVTAQIVVTDGIMFKGFGWNKTILTAQNNLNADMFKIVGGNILFEDLTLLGNKANQTSGSLMNFNPAAPKEQAWINRCQFQQAKLNSIRVAQDTPAGTYKYLRINESLISQSGSDQVMFGAYSFNNWIVDSTVASNWTGGKGIFGNSATSVTCTNNNVFQNGDDGYTFAGGAGCVINGGNVDNNVGAGLRLNGPCHRMTIGGGIQLNGNSFLAQGVSDGIVIVDCTDQIEVSDFICTDSQGTKTQAYGISLRGTSEGLNIHDGDCTGNFAAPVLISNGVAHRIFNVKGFNPQGVAAISPGASPYTYTNNDSVREAVYLDGARGAAGTLTVTKNSIVVHSIGNSEKYHLTEWLEPAEAVLVTYTSGGGDTLTMNKDRK